MGKMTVESKYAAGMILISNEPPLKLLLLKHADRWDLPKGHVDGNERLIETAFRETWEETGIPSDRIQLDKSFQFVIEYLVKPSKGGQHRKAVTYFLGSVDSSISIVLTEHLGYEWISLPVRHSIQKETIDPMLEQLQQYLALD